MKVIQLYLLYLKLFYFSITHLHRISEVKIIFRWKLQHLTSKSVTIHILSCEDPVTAHLPDFCVDLSLAPVDQNPLAALMISLVLFLDESQSSQFSLKTASMTCSGFSATEEKFLKKL